MPTPVSLPTGSTTHAGWPLGHVEVDLSRAENPQAVARLAVRTTFDGFPKPWVEDVELVADELVGNACTHSGRAESVHMVMDLYPWGAAIQVHDGGVDIEAVPRHPQPPVGLSTSGRGLLLVSALAHAWSVGEREHGKCVTAIFMLDSVGGATSL
jgi:anti-sigma regulatory factor (Ser/Thr protein kinase)